MRNSNLLLIGYRGTGKTTVGRRLADRLGWTFVDADDEIERVAGRSIAEIFATSGEEVFRDLEEEVVARLCGAKQHVISLGGGAILRDSNREKIANAGEVIWLIASPQTIHQRLESDASTRQRRPNLTSQGGLAEIEAVLELRQPFYRECANFEVDTDTCSLDDVAGKIVSHFESDIE